MVDRREPAEKAELEATKGSGSSDTENWAARATDGDQEPRPRNKGGRPRGRRDSKPRKRPGSRPAPQASEPEPPPVDDTPPTDAEIAGTAQLMGIAWRLMGSRMNRRPLSSEEQQELALAAIPMMRKYGGGFLEEWGAEITFIMVVLGLWERTKQEPAPGSALEVPATYFADDPERHGETVGA